MGKRERERKSKRPAAPSPASDATTPRHRAWFGVLAASLIPILLLLASEGALRVAGYGYRTGFFETSRTPIGDVWVDNPNFGRRFFPPGLVRAAQPFAIPVSKPPNALRVFVLGESAAMGDPDFKFGLPRMLEVLLRERYPSRKVEVINAGIVAINSHVILPIARDCATRQGDLWVIYMGNNEIVGPFGSASIFGARAPALPLVRAGLWLRSLRLGQLFEAAMRLVRAAGPTRQWGGMEMMAEQKVSHDSAATSRVYAHFERNLMDILAIAARARVPVVLCTVPTNLKDCAPFASLHRANLSEPELNRWKAAYQAGMTLETEGKLPEADKAYQQAGGIDAEFADLAFRHAECSRLLGDDVKAAADYTRARDLDALQFRADSRINEIIRRGQVAFSGRGVALLDAEKLFVTNSSQGLVGNQFFYEHVHLTPEGNYLLARGAAEQAERLLGLERGPEWVSQSECWRLLGLTDWNRFDAYNVILDRIQRAPFITQLNHSQEVQAVQQQLARYRPATKPAQAQREAGQVAQLVARYPDDADFRWNLAALLESAGESQAAEEQWRTLVKLQPRSALPLYNLAKLLDNLGRGSDALPIYAQCLRIDPGYYLARYNLGALLLQNGRAQDAVRHLKVATRENPGAVEAHLALAQAYGTLNRPSEAEQQWREVLRLDPGNATALAQLHLGHTPVTTKP